MTDVAKSIRATRWWEQYEPFDLGEIAQNLNISRSEAREALEAMGDEVTVSEGGRGHGSNRLIYRRRSPSSDWLRRAWR